ncbi:retrovirus-related pol polyprotein from transposon TNT 1-94 [Tanacetum coccineum]
MEILVKTCLMPLALKTQNDSFAFVHELKQEMHADLKYVESLEDELDELESDKAEFSNMYDMLLQECVSKDVMCSYLQSSSDLDEITELQCLYLHKVRECDCLAQKLSEQTEFVSKEIYTELLWSFAKLEKHSISLEIALQECQEQLKNDTVCKEKASNVFRKEREQYFEIQDLKAQLQDKNIAISELKKLIEKCKGKSMDTKFDKPSVVQQPNAQRIPKPSVLGKPAPFSDSLERKYFAKKKSVLKTNESEGLSKPVTPQNLPQTTMQAVRNINVIKPGVAHRTNVSRPQPRSNQMKDKVLSDNSQVEFKKTEVEEHPRISSISNQTKFVTACNNSLKSRTSNVNVVRATCGKCLFNSNHDACVSKFLNDVNARKPKSQANKSVATPHKKIVASESTITNSKSYYKMLYKKTNKAWKWWIAQQCPSAYTWIVQLILFIVDSGCTKHMTGNLSLLCNFVEKYLGTVRFGNDQFAPILGYGDLVQGNIMIKRVYYVEDLQGNDLLTGNRGTDLYTIYLQETTSSTLICLMAKASPTQAWLWHRRLSHLNFDYINLLSKKDVVIGLPKLKYVKDQLCSSCEVSKAKRSSFKSKTVPSSKGRLNLLHMDLCGPMRVASINGKKYILVIVDDYSRYTWTLFLRSKDETPEVLKDFLTMIQRNLQAPVISVRTDRGTEFLNKTLNAFFKEEGIEHQTSTPRTPEQNGVVERRNRTLVEAARTMLSASKLPLFFWAEAIATACYTQNRSIIIPTHEKTAYHIINDRKPSIKHLHIFGCTCYLTRDGEILDKMKEKGDPCILVGYSTQSRGYPWSTTKEQKLIAKVVESKNANHSEPSQTWGSNATDIPSSSSLVMTGHNLFSVGQFCDADLEVAFQKNTCFIRNLEGVDLLSGSRDTNLYIISLDDMLKSSPICLLSKASKTKSWLWHRRLSHLNFACALGKSKKTSHQPKAEDTNQEKLYLLHMDLCGPMRVASINGKRYILVIVEDYSRFTWVRFLKTKDEAPAAIIKCIKNIQVRLKAIVRNVQTDNGTEFVNQTLREWYENVGILHQTSVARTPQQNGVVERRNRTLVEAARTMLIFSKAPLFL